jgi:hypothetical protein
MKIAVTAGKHRVQGLEPAELLNDTQL